MKLIRKTDILPQNDYLQQYFTEHSAFFDIETTGFSPKTSFVYLIGLALPGENNTVHIRQFLAENRNEEAAILKSFYQELVSFDTIITFNGLGFDIPFLKAREKLLSLNGNWDSFQYIDLYKITAKLSHLFQLPDKKQKSLEQFLGIHREDAFSGGNLISVYYAYEKQQKPQLESLLLLHNYEDVLGMTELLPLLSYQDFFDAPAEVISANLQNFRPFGASSDETELMLDLKVPVAFPKQIFCQKDFCSLMCQNKIARLIVSVVTGEMKFYYDNYKDYYYLPDEDMAIHKSIASFVDVKHRKKATAATCYKRINGTFLPQAQPLFTPLFYPDKKSGISYFQLTESFLSDSALLDLYAAHLLELFQ